MIKVSELLQKLKTASVKVRLSDDDKLLCELPTTGISAELKAELIAQKEVLRSYLKQLKLGHEYNKIESQTSRFAGAPLSFAQQRLWLIDTLESGSTHYNTYAVFKFNGHFDVKAFRVALVKIVQRHESLRTVFSASDGEPVQNIRLFDEQDAGRVLELKPAAEGDLSEYILAEVNRAFDLSQDYMLRVTVTPIGGARYVVTFVTHHIASDGWSLALLCHELNQFYNAEVSATLPQVAKLDVQYADFAIWHRAQWSDVEEDASMKYWRERLRDIPPQHSLPLKAPRPLKQSYQGARFDLSIDNDMLADLSDYAKQKRVTLFNLLQTAFSLTLAKYTQESTVVMGVPVAGRDHRQIEPLIGFFVNTLVLRSDVDFNSSFVTLLAQNNAANLAAFEHKHVPFDKVIEAAVTERVQGYSPLFQILFAFQNNKQAVFDLDGVDVEDMHFDGQHLRFDLELHITEKEDFCALNFYYATALFSEQTVVSLANAYINVLAQILTDDSQPLTTLKLLPPNEVEYFTKTLNDTAQDYAKALCIHESIEQVAAVQPMQVALKFGQKTLTYAELNERSNQVAHYLREHHNVQPDICIGVYIDPSIELIVAMIGVLKAGGAYVPLDPSYPSERIEYIISDAKLSTIVTTANLSTEDKFNALDVLAVEQLTLESDKTHNLAKSELGLSAKNLAYVIYTSGSTGQPKGVMVEHTQVLNLLTGMDKHFALSNKDIALSLTSVSFDIHVLEIFLPLFSGSSVVIASKEDATQSTNLIRTIAHEQVNFMQATPATWQMLSDANWSPQSSITCLCGGDALSNKLKDRLLSHPAVTLWNMYGPTETCVWSSLSKLSLDADVNIGRPIDNTYLYVLDKQHNVVPMGMAGELYIGGAGVTRGYLNNLVLTETRFIDNPFYDQADANDAKQLYRTGDLVRYLSDGKLEYIARLDNQVKVRGFRIELGEIEAQLEKSELVHSANVVISQQQDYDSQLHAHVRLNEQLPLHDPQQQMINTWSSLWSEAYESEPVAEGIDSSAELDTSGWLSSYTGEPVPEQQMTDWVAETVERIEQLKPKKILEIGCGTGMLLASYAKFCDQVVALDVSDSVIQKVQKMVDLNQWSHVELKVGDAHYLANMQVEDFDLIVINSVAQYFPSEQYFNQVIDIALGKLAPDGNVFIGDVRNYDLAVQFASRVVWERRQNDWCVTDFERKVRQLVSEENELLFSPSYFYQLAQTNPYIKGLDIRVKDTIADNEMSSFRYDVTLRKSGKLHRKVVQWVDNLEELKAQLINGAEKVFGIRAVNNPNLQLNERIDNMLALQRGQHAQTLQCDLTQVADNGEYIDQFSQLKALCEQYGYTLTGTCDLNNMWLIDCFMYPNTLDCNQIAFVSGSVSSSEPLFNKPYLHVVGTKVFPLLKEELQAFLPAHMIPHYFNVIDEWPLTANGKIDRKALPVPQWNSTQQYIAPVTEAQQNLCVVWQEMLKVERVGIRDNFFALGGNSLLVSRMIYVFSERYGCHFSVADMYSTQTVEKLAECLKRSDTTNPYALKNHSDGGTAPLSYGQYRVWYTNNIWGQSSVTNIPIGIKVGGDFNCENIASTLSLLFEKHAIFRTKFTEQQGEIQQVIGADIQPIVDYHDLSSLSALNKQQEAAQLTESHGLRLFDLTCVPLISTQVIKLDEQEHLLHFNIHHIILDGWSVMLFINEFLDVYESLSKGKKPDLAPLAYNFKDYSLWQSNFIGSEAAQPQEAFWKEYLAGCNEFLKLPFYLEDNQNELDESGLETVTIDLETKQALEQIGKQHNGSLFNVIHAALALLIARLTGENDFNIGIPVTGRTIPGTENMLGMFLNNLPIRHVIDTNSSFSNLLSKQVDNVNKVLSNQEMPFERILEVSNAKRAGMSTPLFQVFLNMANLPQIERKPRALELEVDDVPYVGNKFDLTLYVTDRDEGIEITCDYNSVIYSKTNILMLLEMYCALLTQAAASPQLQCDRYDLRVASQDMTELSKPLTTSWQGPVHQCFEQCSLTSPEKIALEYGNNKWTYRQLNTIASAYAQRLNALDVQSGDVVGIMATRSDSTVASVLATLKAGGAFMMLSNELPEKRLLQQLELVPPKCIITTDGQLLSPDLQQHLDSINCPIMDVSMTGVSGSDEEVNNLMVSATLDADALAYIAFTSGTSGKPKAVMGRQSSLTVFMPWMAKEFGLTADDKFCMLSGLVHDPLHRDIFTPLCMGATLLVPTQEQYNSYNIKACLQAHQVTTLHLTPSLGEMLLNGVGGEVGSLRRGFFVGEALTTKLVNNFAGVAPNMEVINLYGSTESSRAVSYFRPQGPDEADTKLSNIIPVGKGVEGAQLVVLNSSLMPCGIWETGQIGMRSRHLSKGYHADNEQTDQKFIVNPFSNEDSDIIYLTGDLGRRLPSGNVQCLGRMDKQVKIRGFRVEPLEIQQTLETHPNVDKAAVIAIGDEQSQTVIIGYVVWRSGSSERFERKSVREFLAEVLPNYMIPQQIIEIESIPLTENGKLDTTALKAKVNTSAFDTIAKELPESKTEKELVEIWEELLGHSDICVNEDFFELGGNSLLSTRLLTRLQQKYDVQLDFRKFYENNSIRAVARAVDNAKVASKVANTKTKLNRAVI